MVQEKAQVQASAQRSLRLFLRRTREEKGLTQGQIAAALDWSLSKVQRIESGEVRISRTDLLALLNHLGVSDPDKIDELAGIASASRRARRAWWNQPPYSKHLSAATRELLDFESEASAIRVFHPTLVPGLLQVPSYSENVLRVWRAELSDEVRRIRLEIRARRRAHVFERSARPKYLVILDESVLHRDIGGPRTLAEQLDHLLTLVRQGYLTIRVLPFADGGPLAMLNSFVVLDLGEEANAILYKEAQLLDEIEQDRHVIDLYRKRFEGMWDKALSPEATLRLIEARAAALWVDLDRQGHPRSSGP